MTTTAASTHNNNHHLRPLAQTMRYANVLTDAAVTLGALGIIPAALGIDTYTATRGAAFGVSVNIAGRDVNRIDMLTEEIPGDWEPDEGAIGIYQRVGMVRFGGELVRIRVYTGRPWAAR